MKKPRPTSATAHANGVAVGTSDLRVLLAGLQAMRDGNFSIRLPGDWTGLEGKIADTFNEIVAANQTMAQELQRVGQVVGKEGKRVSARAFTSRKGPGARWKSRSTRSSTTCCGRLPKSPAPLRPWHRET